jgi:hypothetical protein
LSGFYFKFKTGGNPKEVTDRGEIRQFGNTLTWYRNGPIGTIARVNSKTATAMEVQIINGNRIEGESPGTIRINGDIDYDDGHTVRKETTCDKSKFSFFGIKSLSTDCFHIFHIA